MPFAFTAAEDAPLFAHRHPVQIRYDALEKPLGFIHDLFEPKWANYGRYIYLFPGLELWYILGGLAISSLKRKPKPPVIVYTARRYYHSTGALVLLKLYSLGSLASNHIPAHLHTGAAETLHSAEMGKSTRCLHTSASDNDVYKP